MGPVSVLGIAVCLTGLVTLSSAQWRTFIFSTASTPQRNTTSTPQRNTTSTPPSSCFLPTIPENGNYSSPLCQYTYDPACQELPGFPVPEYWVLSFTCNGGYSLENQQDSTLVYCINGEWYPEFPKCHTTCGKKHSSPSTTEYPWHVGLYRKKDYSGEWELSCLGTLISSHIVLTAADCVYDERLQRTIHPSEVKVTIGKRYNKWSHNESDSVKADVREISVPLQYIGKRTKHAHNIALLNLEDSVNISSVIMPACFDWDRELTISPGARGTVTGWSGTSSLVNDTHLAYVDYWQCVFDVPVGYSGLVQPDKLCAEHRDGPPLTNLYRGAGLTFVNKGAHYVFGVTSSIIKENRDLTVGLFTNVTNCQLWDWITETKEKFDASCL